MLTTLHDAIFGKAPPTLREMKRENKRTARRAARDISRQMTDIERREADLLKSMKVACKKGDHKTSKAVALDVVRLRRTKNKVAGARSAQMSLESTMNNSINGAAIAESMHHSVVSMQKMSSGMNPSRLRQIGTSFATEMDKMQLVDEVMEDSMAAQAGEHSEDEDEQATELMNQVLHGLAIDANIPAAAKCSPFPSTVHDGMAHAEDGGGAEQSHQPPGSGSGGSGQAGLDLEERLRRLMDN